VSGEVVKTQECNRRARFLRCGSQLAGLLCAPEIVFVPNVAQRTKNKKHGRRRGYINSFLVVGGALACPPLRQQYLVAFQHFYQFVGSRKPLAWLALEAPQDSAFPAGVNTRDVYPRGWRRLAESLESRRKRIIGVERNRACQHLEHHYAQGVDVSRWRDRSAVQLLGGHIRRRADHLLRPSERESGGNKPVRQSKVGDHCPHTARTV